MLGTRTSRRVRVQTGETAVAPKVDDARGFAIDNECGHDVTVSFRYDPLRHVQTVVIEEPRAPAKRIPDETQELPA